MGRTRSYGCYSGMVRIVDAEDDDGLTAFQVASDVEHEEVMQACSSPCFRWQESNRCDGIWRCSLLIPVPVRATTAASQSQPLFLVGAVYVEMFQFPMPFSSLF